MQYALFYSWINSLITKNQFQSNRIIMGSLFFLLWEYGKKLFSKVYVTGIDSHSFVSRPEPTSVQLDTQKKFGGCSIELVKFLDDCNDLWLESRTREEKDSIKNRKRSRYLLSNKISLALIPGKGRDT